jgi:hypothetical protein
MWEHETEGLTEFAMVKRTGSILVQSMEYQPVGLLGQYLVG